MPANKRDFLTQMVIFLKGMCMGIADVIPGVSGGTMALILGIYERFIDALKNLNIRWLYPLFKIVFFGSNPEDSKNFRYHFYRIDIVFLATLGGGIVVALLAGSAIIPFFIDNYPSELRALFFGLILSSAWVPASTAFFEKRGGILRPLIFFVLFLIFGYLITAPGVSFNPPGSLVEVHTLTGEFASDVRHQMSLLPAGDVLELEENGEISERFADYEDKKIPVGTKFYVPRPALWFLFISGAIAISAMILPGISGSYILLILGCYYFILNVVNNFRSTLQQGNIPLHSGGYLIVFLAGIISGLLLFTRVLSYFLHHWHQYSMAALTGLMLGCLRGVWPFRVGRGIEAVNYFPAQFDRHVFRVGICLVSGMIIVMILTFFAAKFAGWQPSQAPAETLEK
ncbi:MAG: DUF368 domain-containing protein [bacterium]